MKRKKETQWLLESKIAADFDPCYYILMFGLDFFFFFFSSYIEEWNSVPKRVLVSLTSRATVGDHVWVCLDQTLTRLIALSQSLRPTYQPIELILDGLP